MDLIERRRALIAAQPRLPWGFQEVSWLEGTGTQQIDLNVTTGYPLSFHAVFIPTERATDALIFGEGTGASAFYIFGLIGSNNRTPGCRFGTISNTWTELSPLPASSGIELDVTVTANSNTDIFISVNGESKRAVNGKYDGTPHPLHLFRGYTTRWYASYIKLRKAEIEIGSKKMILVPCYRTFDYKPGLYDLVDNTFYTNSGTGEFLVGPDVN